MTTYEIRSQSVITTYCRSDSRPGPRSSTWIIRGWSHRCRPVVLKSFAAFLIVLRRGQLRVCVGSKQHFTWNIETFWILVHMYISSQKETHAGEQSWVTSPNATPCSGDDDVYARTIRFIRTLGSYCCAQFAVSKERIRANPLERLGLAIPSWFAVESERFSAETHHLFTLGSHRSLLAGCSKTHTLCSVKSEMHIDYGHLLVVSEEYTWSTPSGRYQRMQEMLFSDSPKECHDIPGHPTLCLMFEAVGSWEYFSAH